MKIFLWLIAFLTIFMIGSASSPETLPSNQLMPSTAQVTDSNTFNATVNTTQYIVPHSELTGKIAFISDWRIDGTRSLGKENHIYVMNADGSHLQFITQSVLGTESEVSTPKLSPDGRYLAYDQSPPIAIRVIDLSRPLFDFWNTEPEFPFHARDFAWSPDGTQLAFMPVPDGGMSKAKLIGTDLTRLVDEQFIFRPSWSPDNQYIAFYGTAQTPNSLTLLTLKNAKLPIHSGDIGVNTLAKDSYGEFAAAWTPDSKNLIYSAPGGIFSIGIQKGEKPIKLISNTAQIMFDNSNVAGEVILSPDGKYLLFTAQDTKTEDINLYFANVDGSDIKLLIRNAYSPSWSQALGLSNVSNPS